MDFLSSAEMTQLIILGIILIIGLLAVKTIFRLTLAILRGGCLVVFLIFIGTAVVMLWR